MAIRMTRGVILNDADAMNHMRGPSDIPALGKRRRPTTTEEDVSTIKILASDEAAVAEDAPAESV